MGAAFFGEPVTPVQRVARSVTALEKLKQGLERKANKVHRQLELQQRKAENIFINEKKRLGGDAQTAYNNVYKTMSTMYESVEQLRVQEQAYRKMAFQISHQAIQLEMNGASLELGTESTKAAIACIHGAYRLHPELVLRVTKEFQLTQAERLATQEELNSVVSDTTDEIMGNNDLFSESDINQQAMGDLEALRLKEGIQDPDALLANAPSMKQRKKMDATMDAILTEAATKEASVSSNLNQAKHK